MEFAWLNASAKSSLIPVPATGLEQVPRLRVSCKNLPGVPSDYYLDIPINVKEIMNDVILIRVEIKIWLYHQRGLKTNNKPLI